MGNGSLLQVTNRNGWATVIYWVTANLYPDLPGYKFKEAVAL